MSHPLLRAIGLVVVICATPVVRFVSCFSVSFALLLSGAVELVRGWAMPPDPPQIPTRDLRLVVQRCAL